MSLLSNTDVMILCGGQGSRLRSVVSDTPKSLASINSKPFLDILIDSLLQAGAKRFILCVGYLREQIITHYQSRQDAFFLFSIEEEPLGTGGAIANALPQIQSSTCLITNGDSLCPVDYESFLSFHRDKETALSMVLSPAPEAKDYGLVEINEEQQLLSFAEKDVHAHSPWISSGIYAMEKDLIAQMPQQQSFSVEKDFFPQIIQRQPCYAYCSQQAVHDIGTPERFANANKLSW